MHALACVNQEAMNFVMTKLVRVAVLSVGLMLGLARPSGAEVIVVPAYTPSIGKETAFRVQLETTIDMRGAEPLGPGTARGDFINRLTVLEHIPNGFRMLWRFDAALSPGAPGSESDYPVNQTFRDAIAFYGVDGLDVNTDASGKPVSVFGIDLIIKNIQKKVDASLGPGNASPKGSILERMQRELAANPVFPVEVLVPAARLLASAQRDRARTDMRVGATETYDQVLQFGGVDTRSTMNQTLQSVDPSAHVATFVWTLERRSGCLYAGHEGDDRQRDRCAAPQARRGSFRAYGGTHQRGDPL